MSISAKGSIPAKETFGTGWSFTGDVDSKSGFLLRDIQHDGHNLAVSMSVERIAVAGFSDGDARRSRNDIANHHVFGLGDCNTVQPPTLEAMAKGATDPLGYYSPKCRAWASYEMANLLNEADQKLEVELAFLFTGYNKDPSHEPGGVLPAARIYPTVSFKAPRVSVAKKKPGYRRVTAVQALIRLHIRVDDRGPGNQCGLFADLENIGAIGGAINATRTGGNPGSFTFNRAEKPVPFDVVGRGIHHGSSQGWDPKQPGWDNIHQYSHPSARTDDPNDGVSDQVFTPGLPYGAHIHWRWGATAATGATGVKGGPQFAGPQGAGSPLIDDRISNQNLEFAIIAIDPANSSKESDFLTKVDQDPVTYLFQDFKDVWASSPYVPELLMPSADLVLWFSITAWGPEWDQPELNFDEFYPGSGVSPEQFPKVKHDVVYSLGEWAGGVIFPQGIFFPHEDAKTFFAGDWSKRAVKLLPGVNKAQYLPKFPDRKWAR